MILDDRFRELTILRRLQATVLAVFAAVAMVIAAVGVYGTVAFTAARQSRIIGLHIALGASSRRVAWHLLRTVIPSLLAGLVFGTLAAFSLSRLLSRLVTDVEPTAVATYVVATLLLATVTVVAAAVPVVRATRVDPMRTMSHE